MSAPTNEELERCIDERAVHEFSQAMSNKLSDKRAEGRYGWHTEGVISVEELREMLHDHLAKGDMVDIANFAMMIWNRERAARLSESGGGQQEVAPGEPANSNLSASPPAPSMADAKGATPETPVMPSAHEHGNCELCDWIERDRDALAERVRELERRNEMQFDTLAQVTWKLQQAESRLATLTDAAKRLAEIYRTHIGSTFRRTPEGDAAVEAIEHMGKETT